MLSPPRDSLTSCTLLLFTLFHLHGSRVKTRDAPLFSIHTESFDISVLEARLHEDLQILRLRMRLEIEPNLPCPQRSLGIRIN